jgi:hypothetical protein
MGEDDTVLHFTKRELQVFALWADANRDDEVTERIFGDPRGLDAYMRAFEKLDKAAWGGATDAPQEESGRRSVVESVVEYRVRRIEGSATDGMEKVCNDLARDGWRLVTASAAATNVMDLYTYLFFSREVADVAIDRAATQFAAMATH